MILDSSVLAVIPARGGSKGVGRKNVKLLAGKPLLAWTIEAARASRYIDRLILTSDDAEVIDTARRYGCEVPFVRPASLATDDAPGMAPILHALQQIPGYDYVVVLQPTSPLRATQDIDACIEKCRQSDVDSCVTVVRSDTPAEWLFVRADGGLIEPLNAVDPNVRRQQTREILALNGAVYVSSVSGIERTGSFLSGRVTCHEMPPERSLDIDTPWDWHLIECLVAAPCFRA